MIKNLEELYQNYSAFLMGGEIYYICVMESHAVEMDKIIVHNISENNLTDYVIYESDVSKITPVEINCQLKKII